MYTLVLFSFRYVVGYLVLACLGLVALLLQPFPSATKVKALLAGVLLCAATGAVRLRPIVKEAQHPGDRTYLTLVDDKDNPPTCNAVAQAFRRMGINPGDEIGVLGHSLDGYYARLAGVRIVAQVWEDPERIEGMSAAQVRQLLAQFKQIGVKAIVSRTSRPGFVNDSGWVAIPRTNFCVRML
jgi:hypothetical protein